MVVLLVGSIAATSCSGGKKASEAPAPAVPSNTELPGTTILHDDFSNAGSGWDVSDNETFSSQYVGGRYRVMAKQKKLFGISSTLYEGPDRPELKQLGQVNVAVTAVGDPANGGSVGLVCRTRGDPNQLDYYGGTLSAAGRWAIVRQQGDRQSQMSSGAAPSGVKFGGAPVVLRLECSGSETDPARVRLYANGKFLGEGVDPSAWASGGAGFIVASTSRSGVVAFLDDFRLSTPA